ncbi:hypothetical protein Amal_02346 [Acetobacter malorum]|uniref:DUF883 domain-containing protein n=1 Tax=Acetobacter malorum TaxID=178901 RepID=A0A177G8I2_9PROT|nr:hypothetical protein [Acetobacter malorum]OAG76572.1 hypothetical protein Amal_02346 [Acetobacter malorum]
MSDEKTVEHKLEDGIGRVQDGAESLLNKAKDQAEDVTSCNKGCAALDAVRDCVADQPVIAASAAGLLGFILGAVIARKS